jgi:hypothetical protein
MNSAAGSMLSIISVVSIAVEIVFMDLGFIDSPTVCRLYRYYPISSFLHLFELY